MDSVEIGEGVWVLSKITEGSSGIVSSEEVLRLANNCSFLRKDHTDGSGRTILTFAGEGCECFTSKQKFFFPDSTLVNWKSR